MSDHKIKLGVAEFAIEPMSLAALRVIGIGNVELKTQDPDPIKNEDDWYGSMFKIAAAGLGWFVDTDGKPKPPEDGGLPDVKRVSALKGVTLVELVDAQRKIYEVAGLIVRKEAGQPAVGEASGGGPDVQPPSLPAQ